MTTHAAPKRRIGFKRWIILALIILGIYLQFWVLKTPLPNVFLPGEPLKTIPQIPGVGYVTNTFVATLLTDIIVLSIGFYIWRKHSLIPSGFYNFLEILFEFLWNTAVSTAGKNARKFYPIIATIFILVLIANWMEMIPGVDSIGLIEPAEEPFQGYEAHSLWPGGPKWIDGNLPVEGYDAEGGEHGECNSCTITPFVRVPATDLNFTLSLALISVFMTQFFGFSALKAGYLTKFINLKTIFTVPFFGAIDFLVGILEIISEFSKIISFTFRLFGNVFAGQLLLFVLGSLLSFALPAGLFIFETFIGLIQAYIFMMLTLVFMQQATVAHGDH